MPISSCEERFTENSRMRQKQLQKPTSTITHVCVFENARVRFLSPLACVFEIFLRYSTRNYKMFRFTFGNGLFRRFVVYTIWRIVYSIVFMHNANGR